MLYIIALLIGEFLIGSLCYEFYPQLGEEITILNACVLTFAWVGIFIPKLKPLIDTNDKAETWVGTLGLKLFGGYWYLTLALCVILGCNALPILAGNEPVLFRYQLWMHLALLLFLCLVFGLSGDVHKHISAVHSKEQHLVQGKETMKMAMQMVMNEVQLSADLPQNVAQQLAQMNDALRFITPNDSPMALQLEANFVDTAGDIQRRIKSGYTLNADDLDRLIKVLSMTLSNRKNLQN